MNCAAAGPRVQALRNVLRPWLTKQLQLISGTSTSNRNMSADQSSSKSTVISDEVSKFASKSETWWDTKNGSAKGLHTLNAIRVPFARDGLLDVAQAPADRRAGPRPLEGFKIVDVGCGAGIYSEALARIGADVTGIDAASELLEVARKHALLDDSLSGNLRYVNATVESHVVDHAGAYDAVVCSEVIEHVDNKDFFVEQCTKLVKSGGSLIFTTINKTWAGWLVMIVGAEYITRIIEKGTHHYHLLMPNKDLENMLTKNGCSLRTVQGFMIKPNLEWAYINSLNVSYAMHAIKK